MPSSQSTGKPRIYCFVNGTWGGDLSVMAVAEDGTALGGHISSNEGYAKRDIGYVRGGLGEHKHSQTYAKHYPGGYEMEWVDNPREHAGLMAAFELNQAMSAEDR